MQKLTTIQTTPPSGRNKAAMRLGRLLLKRIWLPHAVYEALPAIYICSGLVALIAALYLPGSIWILPWAIVFGFAALHLGIRIAALRHKFRRKKKPDPEFDPVQPKSQA
jgi:hypothetical protein